MEPRFVVKSAFDRKAAGVVARVLCRKLMIVWACYTALTLVLSGVFMLGFRDADPFWPVASAAMIILAFVFPRLLAREVYRNYNQKVGEATFSFGEGSMAVSCDIQEAILKYAGLVRMVETKEYFLLSPQKQAAYLLPKAGFCSGNAADFPGFMERATGLKFEHARF